MNKKVLGLIAASTITATTAIAPMSTFAVQGGFMNQNPTQIWVAGASMTDQKQWNWFISFVQSAVNWILAFLGLITIIILIWGGFQMVTAAGDDNKYKKWFTIVKQAAIGLILIGVSALIVNLIFAFVNSNANNSTATTTNP